MKVSDLLESRQANWRELESLCSRLERFWGPRPQAAMLTRLSSLYRAACADLALADAYQLPPGTIQYLHRLVGRAHNQLYRSRLFQFAAWTRELFVEVPKRLYRDPYLRLAFVLFWGVFFLSMLLAHVTPGFAEGIVGEEYLNTMVENHSRRQDGQGGLPAGFYIFNNIGIGLRCFAYGLLFGIGGIYVTVANAAILGAVFGHMLSAPCREKFFEFVTAHGPFELTAIVLSAAAGLRLGFSLVNTHGLSRGASLHLAGKDSMPIMGAAIVMFALAAIIESSVSPSQLPYAVKVGVAIVSMAMLLFYFLVLGRHGNR